MVQLASLLAFAATTLALSHRQSRSHFYKRQLSYQDTVLTHHNAHRANHSAPDLQYDGGLESAAQQIASSCVFEHNMDMNGGGYGQNIASGMDANGVADVISNMWYNSEVDLYQGLYGQPSPDMSNFEAWGHFSQMVWKSTTHVGCATQDCPGGVQNGGGATAFTVCNYMGVGNMAGEFAENVGEPLGMPDVYGK